jgi:hypothetical protein
MSELPIKSDLLRSLGRLVRGLSALFWGLPLTLLVCVKTATSEWLRPFGILPPVFTTGLLFYGLWQLGHFQKQERIWRETLDRAKLLSIVNMGLSPFVFWWNQMPSVPLYYMAVGLLMISSLLFLFNLNQVLHRLSAMLPDETLRVETRFFTSINLYLLIVLVATVLGSVVLQQAHHIPRILVELVSAFEIARQWMLLFLVLLPLAMTMTLIWKIKEIILSSVFGMEA